jgi:ribonuclease J
VGEPIAEAIKSSGGRVIVACFASNIHRIQQIVDAAEEAGRFVSFLGRSMVNNVAVAREMGYLKIPEELIVPINETDQYSPEKIVIISTGSQGEPLSALSLMAARDHKWIELTKGDTVVLSATPVPGNETAVRRVIDGLYRMGARVVAPPSAPVHVSGHAAADDLRVLLDLIKPAWFVPVHGEYRHLAIHAAIALEAGVPEDHTIIMEGGEVLELSGGAVRVADRVEAGFVFVDGLGIGDVEEVVLRDRRLLADEGVIVCVVTIDSQTGGLLAGPDIISRGFVFEDEAAEFLSEARAEIRESLATLSEDEVTDWSAITRKVRKSLGKFVWRRTGRRPIILPVVMEV